MAAWGPATSDGELYHLRSQDSSLDAAIDPITGIPAYENSLIVIRKPINGFASIFPYSPVELGVEGGFNERGICLGWSYSPCKDETLDGIPIVIRQLMVLDHASDLEETIKIINSNRNVGCNLIVSDGKKPEAVVVEQSANHSHVGSWDSSIESNGRYWNINHVARRTNFFINTLLADTQEGYYNQNIFLWSFMPLFCHYVALSKGIERDWAKLDLNRTMAMLRSVYKGKTDIIFLIQKRIISEKEVFNQWVACPKTGDMLFSFARNRKNAYESPVFYVNLFRLLDSEPK